MNELSLFTGAGGGLLGTHLLGWRPIGYVEFSDYCQRVIAQRIADGILPSAPIFGDVRQFVESGAAREYRGFADVVTGGFPCQPFSVAGKRAGADDARNMWPATIATIRAVRPRYCFLENVPGILSSGYFGTILGDLAESGYDCRWRVLSAAEVGAPHKRDRLWMVATDTHHIGGTVVEEAGRGSGDVYRQDGQATAQDARRTDGQHEPGQDGSNRDVAHAEREQNHAQRRDCQPEWHALGRDAEAAQRQDGQADTDGIGGRGGEGGTHVGWWEAEPDVGRVADGMARRVDRLKAIGNGQVPIVAATAWHLLTEDLP